MNMKRVYLSVFVIFLALGVVIVSVKYSKGRSDFGKISDFYGGWSAVETRKFQGTLIPDKKFEQLMKNPLIIEKERMNFFGVEITSPTYKYHKISNKTGGGVIGDRTTSAFYGFYPDRKFVHQFRIMKDAGVEGLFEVLSKKELLFMVAGRIVIVERKR